MSPEMFAPADEQATSNSSEEPPRDKTTQISPQQSTKVAAQPAGDAHDFLVALNVDIRSQEDQEREVAAKLAELHKNAEDERDQKLIEKTEAKIDILAAKKRNLYAQLEARGLDPRRRATILGQIGSIVEQHSVLLADLQVTQDRMKAREEE